jgi:hypothetical protein
MDRHSTRKNGDIHALLRIHNIYLVILPANATTFLQPLDLQVNSIFKRKLQILPFDMDDNHAISKACRERKLIIDKFPQILYETLSPDTIICGWKRSKLDGLLNEEKLKEIPFVKISSEKPFKPIRKKPNSIGGTVVNLDLF